MAKPLQIRLGALERRAFPGSKPGQAEVKAEVKPGGVVIPFSHSSGTSHVPNSRRVGTGRSLQVLGEALFWGRWRCFCDELVVKGAFLEVLHACGSSARS